MSQCRSWDPAREYKERGGVVLGMGRGESRVDRAASCLLHASSWRMAGSVLALTNRRDGMGERTVGNGTWGGWGPRGRVWRGGTATGTGQNRANFVRFQELCHIQVGRVEMLRGFCNRLVQILANGLLLSGSCQRRFIPDCHRGQRPGYRSPLGSDRSLGLPRSEGRWRSFPGTLGGRTGARPR